MTDGGAAVIAVMEDGACYKLLNEPAGATAMVWVALPSLWCGRGRGGTSAPVSWGPIGPIRTHPESLIGIAPMKQSNPAGHGTDLNPNVSESLSSRLSVSGNLTSEYESSTATAQLLRGRRVESFAPSRTCAANWTYCAWIARSALLSA